MKQKGFTILEIIIVLALIGIILPAGFSMFLANLRAQTKVLTLQEVKRNGDTALTVIENLVKTRAESLEQQDGTDICESSGSSYSGGDVYFVDENGDRFRFYDISNRIASESSVIGTQYLTNTRVSVTGFSLTCERDTQFTQPLVNVSFTVSQVQSTPRPEESSTLNYQTKIRLRTF